ncbi:MAG: radical SAM protein [Polyangiaceae bacterium]|nr:radical SAM protein [Polyangiaceae bacterium]
MGELLAQLAAGVVAGTGAVQPAEGPVARRNPAALGVDRGPRRVIAAAVEPAQKPPGSASSASPEIMAFHSWKRGSTPLAAKAAPLSHGRVPNSPLLPPDSVLLPLSEGRLVVSRGHALFCRISDGAARLVESILGGLATANALPTEVASELLRHGFGGEPRAARPVRRSVQLQLTNGCNLACSYCCTNSGPARQREISREQALGVIDQIVEAMGTDVRVGVLGGEPFLVPWAIDLADHVLDRGLSLVVFTNGLCLADDAALIARVAAIAERGAEVRISLAGPTRELCDAASGAPRFDRVLAAAHALARHGAQPTIDLMLTPQQVDTIADKLGELRRELPPGAPLTLGVLYRSGRERGAHLFRSRAALEAALDRIAFEAGEQIRGPTPSPLAARRDGCDCALGHHLHLRSDGALFTCFRMEERIADLATVAFADALRSLPGTARPAMTLPTCAPCPLATLCGGGCRSENLGLTGDADVPFCGPWRVRVVSELLAEDRPDALEWPAAHLLAEAHARGIEAPSSIEPLIPSRHLIDV